MTAVTAVSKKIVNKYSNTVHRTIKLKPIHVTSDSYAEYNEDSSEKNPKLKTDDRDRISKYKNIFAKGYTQNWLKEVFVVSKIKDTVPLTYAISDLNGEPITGTFYEKELQKTNQEKFRIEKLIKRKGDKFTLNANNTIINLIVRLIKKTLYKNESIFCLAG